MKVKLDLKIYVINVIPSNKFSFHVWNFHKIAPKWEPNIFFTFEFSKFNFMACAFAHIGMEPFMEKFSLDLGESKKGHFRQGSNK